jgi:thiol-disulfide isomerase/thioredoxin
MAITVGHPAPDVPGASMSGPHALFFYKVTCPTCQMAAPAVDRFERAYPGRIVGVGQDPDGALSAFSAEFGMSFPSRSDEPPYGSSNGYGIEHVPTLVVIDGDGVIADVVESWDRAGYNRASTTLAGLLAVERATISEPADGLPEFRPG